SGRCKSRLHLEPALVFRCLLRDHLLERRHGSFADVLAERTTGMQAQSESGNLIAQSSEETGWVYMSEHAEISSGLTTPPIVCSPAARRMRAHRKRRQAGRRCLTIELRETEVTELIRRKLLEADARHDKNAVRVALYRHLDDTLDA